MIRASDAFRAEIPKNGRTFEARILTDGSERTGMAIRSFNYTASATGGSKIDIGATTCAYINMTLYSPNAFFTGREVALEIRPKIADGTPCEWLSLGYFTCDRPSGDGEDITVTAYDRMLLLETPFVSAISYPANSNAVLQEISTHTGVPVTLPDNSVSIPTEPSDRTCREIVSYIAQLLGKFACIDRAGNLVFRWYEGFGEKILYGRYWNPFTREEADYELEKLECITGYRDGDHGQEEIVVSAGTGTNVIRFTNPYMTQAIIDSVFQDLDGLRFRPGSVTAMGDPQTEPGDLITIYDKTRSYTLAVSSLSFDFDGGLSMTIQSIGNGNSGSDADVNGPTARTVDRIRAEMVLANEVLAKKADIDDLNATNATITNLSAQVASFESVRTDYLAFKTATGQSITAAEANIAQIRTVDLTAVNARIDDLQAVDISAINANITSLTAGVANIKNLLAGNAAATAADVIQLNANNAVIDSAMLRTALINVLSVNDLLAGRISTNKFSIGSDDGGLDMQGNLVQMKDRNGITRIQMGKDAQGNFTFVLMGEGGTGQLLDENGLKAAAISDGLIVDSMVADSSGSYRGISASKLNINSVIGSLNSAGGIKSSAIWFDEENQSLTQIYSAMSSTIQSATESSAEAAAAAKSSENRAAAALAAIEGISTLDAFGVFLSNDAHTVHTRSDGSGGNYAEAYCIVTAVMGDTDVSSHANFVPTPSPGVTGTWNARLRRYQVTAMDGMDGYVDFDVSYGVRTRFVLLPTEQRFLMPDGKAIVVKAGMAHVTKRFSLSKAPDGKTGVSYSLSVSPSIIRKQQDGTLVPGFIALGASLYDDGSRSDYSGYFLIEESVNGTTFTETYRTTTKGSSLGYDPSSGDVMAIRCTLLGDNDEVLDSQTVLIIVDADGIYDALDGMGGRVGEVEEQTARNTTKLAEHEQSMERFRVSFSESIETLQVVTDGILQWEPLEDIDWANGIDHITARVLKGGEDVTSDYPPEWFSYWRKNEEGLVLLGTGYTIDVLIDDVGYTGEIQMVFTTYEAGYVYFPDGHRFALPGGKVVLMNINDY